MRKIVFTGLIIAALVLLTQPLFSAQTTPTEETFSTMKKITWSWTATSSGNASGVTTEYYSGTIERVVIKPVSAAANFDVTLKDDDSVDVLDSGGLNCASGSTTQLQGLLGVSAVANTQLTLDVTNAGSAGTGTVAVYVR